MTLFPPTEAAPTGRHSGGPAPNWLVDSLARMRLANDDDTITASRLPGGVSSDVYAVSVGNRMLCVKRPLHRLRVVAEWHAPLDRGDREVAWLRFAASVRPEAVPQVLGADHVTHAFAMELFDERQFSPWKNLLLKGRANANTASVLGAHLAALHSTSAESPDVMACFADQTMLRTLRIDPYFGAALEVHPDLRDELSSLTADILVPRAVIHGDVSPKNVLVGRGQSILIDAECASVGDPAFDLAFCLTHLVLKTVRRPLWSARYRDLASELLSAYCSNIVTTEPRGLLRRTARQMGGLLLARVDGKSPVEYLGDAQRKVVRRLAMKILRDPPDLPLSVFDLVPARIEGTHRPGDE